MAMWLRISWPEIIGAVVCITLLITAGCGGELRPQDAALQEVVDYNFHIRPILSDRCYACHGPDANARQADLRLDEEAGAKRERLASGGHAIVPGSLRKSRLYSRIRSDDPEVRMPPLESNLSLSDHEIALIGRWIEQGAEWKPHWSFLPAADLPLPVVQQSDWPNNGIDYFTLSRLESKGLTPAPEADPGTLLRRVTLDLTGLPPTLDELDLFLADTSAHAYETVVDRLLNSAAYGEHMASMWLDIARYADTHGYQNDRDRYVWPWRDWVVEAYNQNLPFDEFGTWQLAGDLLPNATLNQRLATTFNRNHRQTNEGGSIEEEFRTEYVADRVNTVGAAFMGLTLECARCHDHKYDPITQANYYGLFSFFNNVDESGQTSHFTNAVPVPALDLPTPDKREELDRLAREIEAAERAVSDLAEVSRNSFASWDQPLPPDTDPKPILACEFERLSGQTLQCNDGIQGTVVFTPDVVPGHRGQAMAFDGESGFSFAGMGEFRRTQPFAVSLWINPGEDTGAIVHRTQAALDAGSRGWELALLDGHLVAQLAHMWPENALRIKTIDTLPLGDWTHVAMTYDGSSRASGVRLYVNGLLTKVETVRDGLTRHITYENMNVPLQIAYRFRDSGLRNGAVDELRLYDRMLYGFEVAHLAEKKDVVPDRDDLFQWYLAHEVMPWQRAQAVLQTLREKENTLLEDIPAIMVTEEMSSPRPAYILNRGQYDAKGDPVEAHTPEAILRLPDDLPRNRLGLARWLFHPEHPLTARVAVNRYWQKYFGTGIVSTPEDFGRQGALPSFPELLDYLATTFVDSGWNIKAMQRLILTSATYRQQSEATPELLGLDPDNTLFARGPRLRLSAEMVRDQALAVSGLLDRTLGGPAVKPYQPKGLWQEKAGIRYEQGSGPDLYRRTLYTFFKRTSPPPSLITFDMPTRAQCVMRRQRTATPMQALVLLNDPQYVEAARHIAARMLGMETLEDQIALGFRLLTGRNPDSPETEALKTLYTEQFEAFSTEPEAARQLLKTGESQLQVGLSSIEWAAHTMVANALLSFDEAIEKY